MRKLAIAVALASTAMATPALAKDGAWYAGVEGGLMVVEDTELDYTDAQRAFTLGFLMNHKVGFDVDALAGYDLGMVRLEAEVAYKRASLQDTKVDPGLSGTTNGTLFFDTSGHVSILTGMANALLDFGDENGWAGYVGGGAGLAQVRYSQDIDLPGFDFSDRQLVRLAGNRRRALRRQPVDGRRPEIPLPQRQQPGVPGGRHGSLRSEGPRAHAQPAGQRFVELRRSSASAASAAASAASASAASSGDADVPGRFGDPGDGRLSGSAASASAAATGARARPKRQSEKKDRPGHHARAGFLLSGSAATALAACARLQGITVGAGPSGWTANCVGGVLSHP